MRVAGIGQCALDHLFIVDSFPLPDTKKEVIEWAIASGGPVATALVSLSRLGVECSFYGVIGDDEGGRKISESLQSEDIDIRGLIRRPDSHSQVAFIAIEKKSGKRTIFWKRPSGAPLSPAELPEGFLDDINFLLLDGLMIDVSLYAAEKARERNIPVMLDAGRLRKGMIELARMCEYVVGSEEFAREVIGTAEPFDPEEALTKLWHPDAKAVTITLGEKGSITTTGEEVFSTPAFKVEVVDTTGAGDVFHGGYIYGLLRGWDIKEVVRFASAFAALKCRRLGGRDGIPGLKETLELCQSKQ